MTLNIAHRGARSIAPENTITAAEKGFESGADLWETDIGVTRDEYLILFHDTSLERTTDAATLFKGDHSLLVIDHSLESIRLLRPGLKFIEDDPFKEISKGNIPPEYLKAYQDEKVPTLEEALIFTRDKGWKINLEMKKLHPRFKDFPLPERVLKIIKHVGISTQQVVISSFHHPWLKKIEAMAPSLEIQALIGENAYMPLKWGKLEFSIYNVNSQRIVGDRIRHLKQMGKKVQLFTVNDKTMMQEWIDLGVDGLFTDYPQVLNAILKQ